MKISKQAPSSENDHLILVDQNNKTIGYQSKAACHSVNGFLHRAFSVFIFNDKKQLLIQKRSNEKMLWPMHWSNSCCSHPRRNETNETATKRRLKEELGITTPLKYLFTFRYYAVFGEVGSEKENCSVYIGKSNGPITANPMEIDEWAFIDLNELETIINNNPDDFTPWLKIEFSKIQMEHMQDIENLYI